MNYLKIEPNQIYNIALKSLSSKEVKGFQGNQLKWTLSDGRAFYTPLFLKSQIEKAAQKPGHRFCLQRAVIRGRDEWRVFDAPQPAARLLDASAALDGVIPDEMPLRPKPPEGPLPDPEPDEDPPPAAITKLEHALKTAVHAAAKAEKHGLLIGYNVRFSPADIRAMAISVLIGMRDAA